MDSFDAHFGLLMGAPFGLEHGNYGFERLGYHWAKQQLTSPEKARSSAERHPRVAPIFWVHIGGHLQSFLEGNARDVIRFCLSPIFWHKTRP